jgi:phosphinothricin acetyltransferase
MQIRAAVAADLAQVQAIYAHHVLNGTGSFEEVPPSLEELTSRFEKTLAHGDGWFVAEDATGILGYGYYGPHHPRTAFRFTVEDSVYVRDGVRGQGVGKALVAALIEHASKAGYKQMVALVGDSENVASVGMHASLGFVHAGTLRKVGFKHERWLDLVIMQKAL